MRVEELLNVPAFGIVQRQRVYLVTVGRGEKGPETVLARCLSGSLGELEVRLFRAMRHSVRLFGRGESRPAACELFGIKSQQLPPQRTIVFHRY